MELKMLMEMKRALMTGAQRNGTTISFQKCKMP